MPYLRDIFVHFSPELILLVGALVLLTYDLVLRGRDGLQPWIALVTLVAAGAANGPLSTGSTVARFLRPATSRHARTASCILSCVKVCSYRTVSRTSSSCKRTDRLHRGSVRHELHANQDALQGRVLHVRRARYTRDEPHGRRE